MIAVEFVALQGQMDLERVRVLEEIVAVMTDIPILPCWKKKVEVLKSLCEGARLTKS